MWSGSGNGEEVIRVIGAKRTLSHKRYKISPQVKYILSRGADLMFRQVPSLMELALQDLASCQVPLLAGVVSLLIGDALQDRFADFARELVDRGKRVLSAER